MEKSVDLESLQVLNVILALPEQKCRDQEVVAETLLKAKFVKESSEIKKMTASEFETYIWDIL